MVTHGIFNADNEPGVVHIARIASDDANARILCDLLAGTGVDEVIVAFTEREEDPTRDIFFVPETDEELGWLGYFLGKCNALDRLTINASSLRGFGLNDIEAFFGGLTRNTSITSYELFWLDEATVDARVVESISVFLRDNHNLVSLSMHNCELGAREWQLVAQSLRDRSVKNLECASFGSSPELEDIYELPIDDGSVAEIIGSLESYSSLSCLSIQCTNMAVRGCTALASLLNQPFWSIEELEIGHNQIGDSSIELILESLRNHVHLQRWRVDVEENPISDRKMLDLFSIRREQGSIMSSWLSVELANLLGRGDFDMEDLYRYDLKLLPNLAATFEAASSHYQNHYGTPPARFSNRRLDVIFTFLRGMPIVGVRA